MSVNDYKLDVISVMDLVGRVLENNLILILQDGVAVGKLPTKSDFEEENSFSNLFKKSFKEFKKSEDQESPQSISLIDVKYTSSGSTINLPYMVFFIDQIVGVSVGVEGQG